MPESYLPTREGDLDRWAATFDGYITAAPTTYGLTAGQATAFNALFTAWHDAYIVTLDNGTRTPASIQTKKLAKQALVDGPGGIRELVAIVQAFPGTTNAMRSELGITIPAPEPTPVPVPVDAPEMDIQKVLGRTVTIRLHNDNVLERKKPVGVKGAAVFSYVGATPPDDLDAWQFQGNTNQTIVEIEFPSTVPAGSQVWLTAFWFNTKAQSGPPCQPNTVYLAGGLQKAA